MFNKTAMMAGCMLAILAVPALAEDKPKPVDDGNKMVCTSEVATGTRFKKKVCMTKAQRDAIAERDRQNFNDTQMKSALNAASTG
jgi:hypothetical protein